MYYHTLKCAILNKRIYRGKTPIYSNKIHYVIQQSVTDFSDLYSTPKIIAFIVSARLVSLLTILWIEALEQLNLRPNSS